jgi:hypothetical protein
VLAAGLALAGALAAGLASVLALAGFAGVVLAGAALGAAVPPQAARSKAALATVILRSRSDEESVSLERGTDPSLRSG